MLDGHERIDFPLPLECRGRSPPQRLIEERANILPDELQVSLLVQDGGAVGGLKGLEIEKAAVSKVLRLSHEADRGCRQRGERCVLIVLITSQTSRARHLSAGRCSYAGSRSAPGGV